MAKDRPKVRTGPGLKKPEFDEWGIGICDYAEQPFRYGFTSDVVRETEKAIQVDYYTWRLWIPKACVRRVDGALYSGIAIINESKDHVSAERISRD